jgi:hypothetical protein
MSASFNTILSLGRAGGIIEAFFSCPNDAPPKNDEGVSVG